MNTIVIDRDDTIAAIIRTFEARLQNSAGPLSLLARFAVQEPHREAVKSAFIRTRSRTLDEPACQVFELNEDSQQPGHFLIYEKWRSLTDLEAHLRAAHIAGLRALFHRLIVDGPEFQVLLPAE
jgi:quinol monooxygenase YgiN